MYRSVISSFMLLSIGFLDINIAQTTCGNGCPCDCTNDDNILDCSGLGLSNVTVCGTLEDFQKVNFTNNDITELEATVRACSLNVSGNRINSVEVLWQPSSYNCPNFNLDLSHNVIQSLSEGAIHLEYMSFQSESLLEVDLSSNNIEYLEHLSISINNKFRGTKTEIIILDLTFNKILYVHPTSFLFNALFGEIQVLLNNNNLSNFTVSSFVANAGNNVEDHYVINLRNNNISGFQVEDIDSPIVDHVSLILDGNPWNCDCSQRYVSLNTSRLQRFLRDGISVEPICEVPEFVKGRRLLSLSEDELLCEPKLDQNANLDVQVSAGDTLRLLCPVIGANPPITNVDWQIPTGSPAQGQETSLIHVRTCFNCSLVISKMQKVLEGDYQCTVFNGRSLTIVQKVIVDESMTLKSEGNTSLIESCDSVIAAAKRPLLIVVIFLSVIPVIVAVCLVVVCYKLYKTKENEIPQPQKCRTDTLQNVPGSPRYDVSVENDAFDDKEEYFLEPKENEIPLRVKGKNDTSQNAPGSPTYAVSGKHKSFVVNKGIGYLEPAEQTLKIDETKCIYEINDIDVTAYADNDNNNDNNVIYMVS